jgi:hypothetical protein
MRPRGASTSKSGCVAASAAKKARSAVWWTSSWETEYPMKTKILMFGLFSLALITTALITRPMSAGTVALVTVQTLPTPPDWRAPAGSRERHFN